MYISLLNSNNFSLLLFKIYMLLFKAFIIICDNFLIIYMWQFINILIMKNFIGYVTNNIIINNSRFKYKII